MTKSTKLTNATGAPVADNTNIRTAGPRGPSVERMTRSEPLAQPGRLATVLGAPPEPARGSRDGRVVAEADERREDQKIGEDLDDGEQVGQEVEP